MGVVRSADWTNRDEDGGTIATVSSNKAELSDPRTDTFTPTCSMTTGQCNPGNALPPDGRVLILPSEEGDDYGTLSSTTPAAKLSLHWIGTEMAA